jgi:dehydrogenase/reductase SDR family member 12
MYTAPLEVAGMETGGFAPSATYDGTAVYAKDKRRQVAITERYAQLWASKGTARVERERLGTLWCASDAQRLFPCVQ